jgi:hypothetical protein
MKAFNIFKTPVDSHYFFGYYDKLQLNKDNSKLLILKVDFMDHVPNKNDKATIGYFDLENKNKFIKITTTRAFNWQQGCMLQWLGPDYNKRVIYNDLIDNKLVSVILDLETDRKKIIEKAVYSTHPNGKHAITIDFERHHWCRRGYSYDGNFSEKKNKPIVDNDAIWHLDLEANKSKKIIYLKDMIKYKPLSNMENATHYLEHLMFNTTGNRFCFLHRWKIADGGVYARLYTVNTDGSDLYLLNDSGRVGHFCWQDDQHLLVYGGLENKINSLRKHKKILKYFIKPLLPLYHKLVNDNSKLSKAVTGDSYVLFTDKTKEVERVAADISNEDGHPSFSREGNKDVFITDIYPDPNEGSIAKLIMFNLAKNKHVLLDELSSIQEYDDTPLRCDLHPRWSSDGEFISIDTMDSGVRGCYLYKVSK